MQEEEPKPINYVLLIIIGIIVVSIAIGIIYYIFNSKEFCRLLSDIISFIPFLSKTIATIYGGFPC
ncbi:MAG: hypothetical protein ACE5J4_03025 [Candidatus Aenigmatarchaeota archaeon]